MSFTTVLCIFAVCVTVLLLALLHSSINGRYLVLKQGGKCSVYTTRCFPYLAEEGDMYLDRKENQIHIYTKHKWEPLIV